MPLNYQGQEKIGNLDVWSFTAEDGSPFKTDDPMMALQLGAPVGTEPPSFGAEQTPLAQSVPEPAPLPDQRQALGMFGPGRPPPASPPGLMGTPDPVLQRADVGGMSTEPMMSEAPPEPQAVAAPAPLTGPGGEVLDFGDGEQAPQGATSAPGRPAPQGRDYLSPTIGAGLAPPPPSPYTYDAGSRGGFVDTTRSFRGDPERVAEMRARQSGITDAQTQSTMARMDLDTERLRAEQTELEKRRVTQQQEIEAQNAVVAEREEYKRTKRQKLANQRQEIASRTVDSKRLFRDDPGATFLAAIAYGMGQFGASLNGGPNMAAQLIENAIQRDINDQQGDIDRAYLDNEKADNALQRELDEGKDPRFARLTLETLQNDYALTHLRSKEVQQQLQSIGVDTADVVIALQEKQLDRDMAIEQMLGVQANQKYNAPRAAGYRANPKYGEQLGQWIDNTKGMAELSGNKPLDAVIVEDAKARTSGADETRDYMWRGKKIGTYKSATEAATNRPKMATLQLFEDNLAELERKAENWNSLSPEDRKLAEGMVAELQMQKQMLNEQGVLNEADLPFIEKAVPNPNEFFTLGDPVKVLRQSRELARRRRNSLFDQHNVDPDAYGLE